MRQITEQAGAAFNYGYPFSQSNTTVSKDNTGRQLYLHGHKIAWTDEKNNIYFSMCGWPTVTTRERLQAAGVRICQRKGEQYYMIDNNTLIPIDPSSVYKYDEDGITLIEGKN